jgi:nitrite reductase/ring-hydroxylating ferredoxin subunit
MGRTHRVPLSALGPDGRTVVSLDGEEVALFRVDGTVYAFRNACPHSGNPLVEGEIAGGTLTCAYHLWRFDLETGNCVWGEAPARRYPADVRGATILVDLT